MEGNNMKKILITGAAGFIGFHSALHHHRRGDVVVGYDNFNDYYDPQLKRARAKILEEEGVVMIEGDICDGAKVAEIVDDNKITHVLHLAAQAGVRYSLENPQAYITSNIEGFLTLLEVMRQRPHIPFVYASSSSVYGLNEKIPFSVDDVTDRQASLYGATKKSNELMAHTYHHLFGIPVTGLRFFTVYGPWGRPDMAYFSFTKAILEGKTIDVYNNGDLSRDCTYIDDIVDGVAAAIDLGAECEMFNLGNNEPETLENFIGIIEEALDIKANKRYLPMQAGDVMQTFADIDHSKELLGFEPKTSLTEGIKKFVAWYKGYYK